MLIGTYFTIDSTRAKIYMENGKGYFESQGSKNELSLLQNDSWLVLGLDYEYILSLDKNGKLEIKVVDKTSLADIMKYFELNAFAINVEHEASCVFLTVTRK